MTAIATSASDTRPHITVMRDGVHRDFDAYWGAITAPLQGVPQAGRLSGLGADTVPST
jgi:hypothetical protein